MITTAQPTHAHTCPICSSKLKTWRSKQVDTQTYKFDRCQSCDFCFVNPKPSLDFIMDYYASQEQDFSPESSTPPTLEAALEQEKVFPNAVLDAKRIIKTLDKHIPTQTKGRFFDVGSGYGFFTQAALQAGYKVVSLDLDPHVRMISQQMTGIVPHDCSFEDFQCVPGSLQVILMSQILEHVVDINHWIEKSYELLDEKGMLVVALPNFGSLTRKMLQDKDPFICPPAHLNHFSPRNLTRLMAKHGFTVRDVQWVSRMPTRSIERRLPKVGKPLMPAIRLAANATFKAMDILRHGMIINVYGQKITG